MKQIVIVVAILFSVVTLHTDSYQEAYTAYQNGERAETIEKRSLFFNQALKLYSEIEKEDGQLYYNIGNCYYQLNQMGMAIWYYTKAERLLPRDLKIAENLAMAKSMVKLETPSWNMMIKEIFFFHYKLKTHEKALVMMFIGALLLFFVSLFIWIKKSYLKPFIYMALFFLGGFTLSYNLSNQSNKAGLFVEPSLLRCAAGKEYKEISSKVIKEGEMFKVLEITPDQKWVKVKTSRGKKGYVEASHTRLL